jgi:hypothetical protein
MKPLTPVQQAIIEYIIAENEEAEEDINPVAPYMQALKGDFKPEIPFTLYRDETAGLVLYVQNPEQDSPEQFRTRCRLIKKQFLEIADFIRYLAQERYVRTLFDEPEKPSNIPEQWRPYTEFTPAEQKGLLFAGSYRLVPRLTLYECWEAMHEKLLQAEQIQEVVV